MRVLRIGQLRAHGALGLSNSAAPTFPALSQIGVTLLVTGAGNGMFSAGPTTGSCSDNPLEPSPLVGLPAAAGYNMTGNNLRKCRSPHPLVFFW